MLNNWTNQLLESVKPSRKAKVDAGTIYDETLYADIPNDNGITIELFGGKYWWTKVPNPSYELTPDGESPVASYWHGPYPSRSRATTEAERYSGPDDEYVDNSGVTRFVKYNESRKRFVSKKRSVNEVDAEKYITGAEFLVALKVSDPEALKEIVDQFSAHLAQLQELSGKVKAMEQEMEDTWGDVGELKKDFSRAFQQSLEVENKGKKAKQMAQDLVEGSLYILRQERGMAIGTPAVTSAKALIEALKALKKIDAKVMALIESTNDKLQSVKPVPKERAPVLVAVDKSAKIEEGVLDNIKRLVSKIVGWLRSFTKDQKEVSGELDGWIKNAEKTKAEWAKVVATLKKESE